jgi:hypothetical protein
MVIIMGDIATGGGLKLRLPSNYIDKRVNMQPSPVIQQKTILLFLSIAILAEL